MSKFKPRQHRVLEAKSLVSGLRKRLGPKDVVVIGGESVSRAELVKLLEEQIALEEAIEQAHAAWLRTLVDADAFAKKHKETLSLFRRWLHVTFGRRAEILVDFGLEPQKKARPLTSEEKKAVVAKIRATRAARHTMGPRQRAAIKADAPPVAEDAAAEE